MISQPMPITPVPLRNRYLAAFLAWLVPGSGHIYQGRTAKGILYGLCILSLYFLGFALGDGKIVYWRWVNPMQNPDKFCLHYVGQFFVGLPALPALVQSTLNHYGLQPILGGFMAEPSQNVINGLQRYGKLIEVGTIYTTVAGLLNVLAIYDAFDGPAYAELDDVEELAVTVPPEVKMESLKTEGSA